MKVGCPSDLALEQYVRAPARSTVMHHVTGCDVCQARLARLEQEGAAFDALVWPATVHRVLDRRPTGWRLPSWLWLAPLPAFAALLIVWVRTDGPVSSDGYVGRKGADLMLTVLASFPDGDRPLKDGERVSPDATLRFEVDAARKCWLSIVAVDSDARVEKLFPANRDSQEIRTAGSLPGSVHLDSHTGPERLFAVCSPKPIGFETLAQMVAGSGSGQVRQIQTVQGLGEGAMQSTLLLEKRR
jgi:hypothetical protein